MYIGLYIILNILFLEDIIYFEVIYFMYYNVIVIFLDYYFVLRILLFVMFYDLVDNELFLFCII